MLKYFLDEYRINDVVNNDEYKYVEDNMIHNYLNYWIKYQELYNKFNVPYNKNKYIYLMELDKLWIIKEKEGKIDSDIIKKYEKENIKCDTLFSLKMPLKMILESTKMDEKLIRTNGIVKMDGNNLKIIRDSKLYKEDKDLYLAFLEVANLACKRCNVFNYPLGIVDYFNKRPRDFNGHRGCTYYDQMPITLANCFDGDYTKLFTDYSVEKWIENENLEMFFINKIVDKDNIKNLGPLTCYEKLWITKKEELISMLNAYKEILSEREK